MKNKWPKGVRWHTNTYKGSSDFFISCELYYKLIRQIAREEGCDLRIMIKRKAYARDGSPRGPEARAIGIADADRERFWAVYNGIKRRLYEFTGDYCGYNASYKTIGRKRLSEWIREVIREAI